MSPLLVAAMLGQIKGDDTGALPTFIQNALDKAANMAIVQKFLPVVQPVSGLPIVPDGTVAGKPYIPPNTTADVVTNSAALASSYKRTALLAAGVGAVVGGAAVWLLKRR